MSEQLRGMVVKTLWDFLRSGGGGRCRECRKRMNYTFSVFLSYFQLSIFPEEYLRRAPLSWVQRVALGAWHTSQSYALKFETGLCGGMSGKTKI